MKFRTRPYARVAWCYDEVAAIWSLGAIPRAKAIAARALEAGEHVLFAGVGRGADAWLAAERGVRVRALDAEPAMLRRLERRRSAGNARVHCSCEDWLEHVPAERYDAVVASFVLNVFTGGELARALDVLTGWVRPGGRVFVVDFAPPDGGRVSRLARQLHYWPVAAAARVLGLCGLHPIYDYAPMLAQRGFDLKEQLDVGAYRVWTAYLPETVARGQGSRLQPPRTGRQ